MTAHNLRVEIGVNERACAVTARAYSHSVVLRTTFLFVNLVQATLWN
jgi:hypothetical protein